PPNGLGLCDADVRRTLLEYGAARESDDGLAELARTFEGAWPYLELIAGANGIVDPLYPRVVEAYWVGKGLALVGPPEPGDHVSPHSDFVCAVLAPTAGAALDRATRRALRAVNPVVERRGVGA